MFRNVEQGPHCHSNAYLRAITLYRVFLFEPVATSLAFTLPTFQY